MLSNNQGMWSFTKIIFIFVISLICIQKGKAQKRDYVWILGESNILTADTMGWNTFLDFSNSPPSMYFDSAKIDTEDQNAIISDDTGKLLFYSSGCFIRNHYYDKIYNSDTLAPVFANFNNCTDYSSLVPADGMLILQDNYQSNRFWFINLGIDLIKFQDGSFDVYAKCFYSIVDADANQGQGAVISKGNKLGPDSLYSKIHAIPHENGKDWWVMLGARNSNMFYPVLIDSIGPRVVDTIALTGAPEKITGSGGQVVFSPIGNNFMQYSPNLGVYWMGFDRATGKVSNLQYHQWETSALFGGASISPSGQYAYFNDYTRVWQMDLSAQDPPSTFTLIGEWDGYIDENNKPVGFSRQRLGPDCRIYIGPTDFTRYIHVIEYPDLPYPDCSFQQRYIHTPTIITDGMPNFPLFRVGTQWPVCDSSLTIPTVIQEPDHHSSDLTMWPNPCTTALTIDLGSLPGAGVLLQVYDLQGRLLESKSASAVQEVLFTAHWVPGVYFIRLIDERGRSRVGKVVKE